MLFFSEIQKMNKVDCALSCFEEGFSCSQAVFSTYGPQLGLDRERALKIAGTFGGGMGRMGEIKYGNSKAEDNPSKEKAYSLVREFADRFQSRNGTIGCRELLGCELSTPEGRALAREKNLFATICPKLVQDAAKIIEQILE